MSQKAKYGVTGAAKVRQRRRRLNKKMRSEWWQVRNCDRMKWKGSIKKAFVKAAIASRHKEYIFVSWQL